MNELDILEQAIKQHREDGERALIPPWDGIADVMFDVVKAAEYTCHHDLSTDHPSHPLIVAITALKAKIAGMKP